MKGWVLVAIALSCAACTTTSTGGGTSLRDPHHTEDGNIVGLTTRDEIESELPAWREAIAAADFERGTAAELGLVAEGAEVVVVLGTWCGDSRREISRLFRALEIPPSLPFTIRFIGVDRAKHAPEVSPEMNIVRVPTIIVRREGVEVGRIVESAPRGIERELVELLAGRSSGVISLRTDL